MAAFARQLAWLGPPARLYAILILGVPLGIGVMQTGNAGFARYYLCSAVGLLLLVAETIGQGLRTHIGARAGSAVAIALLVCVRLTGNPQLIRLQRGDPDRPVQLMVKLSPERARVIIEPQRFEKILRVVAHRAGYAIDFSEECAGADFVMTANKPATGSAAPLVRCGTRFLFPGSSDTVPLTGDAWRLYGAERLQSARSPVSGPVKAH